MKQVRLDIDEKNEIENLNMLTRKFSKFLKKKGKDKNQ